MSDDEFLSLSQQEHEDRFRRTFRQLFQDPKTVCASKLALYEGVAKLIRTKFVEEPEKTGNMPVELFDLWLNVFREEIMTALATSQIYLSLNSLTCYFADYFSFAINHNWACFSIDRAGYCTPNF